VHSFFLPIGRYMKAVILAGGLGTRLSEETELKPKPMVEIGGMPILWHLIKIYSQHNVSEFIICLGYKGYLIKEYFANYFLHMSDVTFDMQNNQMEVHQKNAEPWKVTLINTGDSTMTGGRLKRVQSYIGDEDFCFTYGDGLSDVNITESIKFHKSHGRHATVTAVKQAGRFGALDLNGHQINAFEEKPRGDGAWINGGYFVLSPSIFEYIQDDSTIWEQGPMLQLTNDGQMNAFLHEGFWQPMDTLRDKKMLEKMWLAEQAPWKIW